MTVKSKTGYKVVRDIDGNLFSAIASQCSARIEYKLGVEAVPNFGKLLAFDTLTNARVFVGAGQHFGTAPPILRIFEAQLRGDVCQERLATNASEFVDFWHDSPHVRAMKAPIGTLSCEGITLLREVKV